MEAKFPIFKAKWNKDKNKMSPTSSKVIRTFKTKQENLELNEFIVRHTECFKPVGLSKINQIGIPKWFINLHYAVNPAFIHSAFKQESMVFIKKIAASADLPPVCLDQKSCFCSLTMAFAPYFRFSLYLLLIRCN